MRVKITINKKKHEVETKGEVEIECGRERG